MSGDKNIDVDVETVEAFTAVCMQMYRACCNGLVRNCDSANIGTLLDLANSGEIDRKTFVAENGQSRYSLHIHGIGYTIENTSTKTVARFNVRIIEDQLVMSFTSFDVVVFLKSVGFSVKLGEVEIAVIRVASENQWLKHYSHGLSSFFVLSPAHILTLDETQG